MSQLLDLPFASSNQFVVVDEGVDATHAESLIIAWLQALRKRNPQQTICFFLFSKPKYCLERHMKSANLEDITIIDYFSADIKESSDENENELQTSIINSFIYYESSVIVIDCLSTLVLQVGLAKACKIIERLCQRHKSPVFCIYRRDIFQSIPRIETLGNIYIELKKLKKIVDESNIYYEVSIIHKKAGGSIIRWNELVKQNMQNYNITTEKVPVSANIRPEIHKPAETTVKPQSSFRLEMNEQEIKQRDSVPLPYILPGNPGGGSKIIYVPDDADDLDEEDPDDDLDI